MVHGFRFVIGTKRFLIEGDRSVIEALRVYYCGLSDESGAAVDFEARWNGLTCVWGPSDGAKAMARVLDMRVRPTLTVFLAMRMLSEGDPSLTLFHGAAIFWREHNRILLLFGHSHSGKTTLSRLLTDDDPGAVVLADDELLLNLSSAVELVPLPRASAVRDPGTEGAIMPWATFTGEHGGKTLVPGVGGETPSAAQPLVRPHVLILSRDGEPDTGDSSPEAHSRFWATFADAATDKALLDEGLPFDRSERIGSCHRLDFSRVLSHKESLRAIDRIEERGGVVVSARNQLGAGGAATPAFASAPKAVDLSPHEGVRQMLSYRLRYSLRGDPSTPGEQFFSLSRGLADARFHAVTPGGTPEQSVHTITEMLRSDRQGAESEAASNASFIERNSR